MKSIVTFAIGALFGLGLIISQMTNPDKVRSFLTFGSDWDGSLVFVMAVAMGIMMLVWRWQRKQSAPLFAKEFSLSQFKRADGRLLLGSALFGLGWGLSNICPGPGLVQLASLNADFWLFFVSVLAGVYIAKRVAR